MIDDKSPLQRLKIQRSHILFVLSQPRQGCEETFLGWYRSVYREEIETLTGVLRARHYRRDAVDITRGRYPQLPFEYLGIYELSLDGAEAAQSVIEQVALLHREQQAAKAPATWLYYPVSESVGREESSRSSMKVLAFANGLSGEESAFREWYATRHIRHALELPVLVSGQCFQRTGFQRPGALEAKFDMIAMYDYAADAAQAFFEAAAALPPGALPFPMLDRSRFAEALYRPI